MQHDFTGVRKPPPKSNTQRQRQFRARHPHYYRDLHRKRNAAIDAQIAARAEPIQTPPATPQTHVPLALPAPTLIPADRVIDLPLFAHHPHQREPVPVAATTRPANQRL